MIKGRESLLTFPDVTMWWLMFKKWYKENSPGKGSSQQALKNKMLQKCLKQYTEKNQVETWRQKSIQKKNTYVKTARAMWEERKSWTRIKALPIDIGDCSRMQESAAEGKSHRLAWQNLGCQKQWQHLWFWIKEVIFFQKNIREHLFWHRGLNPRTLLFQIRFKHWLLCFLPVQLPLTHSRS